MLCKIKQFTRVAYRSPDGVILDVHKLSFQGVVNITTRYEMGDGSYDYRGVDISTGKVYFIDMSTPSTVTPINPFHSLNSPSIKLVPFSGTGLEGTLLDKAV